jgi:glycosidase
MGHYYPSLYQVNTRVWLTELSQGLNRKATLDDIPDSELDRFAELGFDWIWFLSVWRTGKLSRQVSLNNPEWCSDFEKTLPDLKDEDIGGSGFAIADYSVAPELGGEDALKRLRIRLKERNLKLMLDFVPNHMGPDHRWAEEHPDYFVQGTESDIKKSPQNFTRIKSGNEDLILAYGRDPYFSGWPDTIQLDYSNPDTAAAMKNELLRISEQCDGVRCDMAMLVLPDIFERTWGRKAQPFWSEAIAAVHVNVPDFCFMAEVYWDMEWTMQQLGFDYAYDKRLYDRLAEGHARAVREHFYADSGYQNRLARFLENHDEPRAASVFERKNHEAAAIITFLSPGLRFFLQGQFDGKRQRISPHLIRGPEEPVDLWLRKFYSELISVLKKPLFREGKWKLLQCCQAWEGNYSCDSFLAFEWEGPNDEKALVAVNYSPHSSQCFVRLPIQGIGGKVIRFHDLMNPNQYERDGEELLSRGIFLDMPGWGYHLFEMTAI